MHYWFEDNTINNGGKNVPLNYDFSVDWGDGSELQRFTYNGDTTLGILPTSECIHKYSKPGLYRITFHGILDSLKGHNGNVYQGNKRSISLIKNLVGVLVPKNSYSPLKFAPGTFFGCENMYYLGKGVFDNLTECKSVAHLFDGCKIKQIPDGIFDNCKEMENVSFAFEACDIFYVPDKIFHNLTKLKTVECCFHRCNNLNKVPDDLFKNNTEITDVTKTFNACKNLNHVSPNIFDNCLKINKAKETFSKELYISGYAPYQYIDFVPELWKRKDENGDYIIKNFEYYARGCIYASNYDDIPINWR